MALYGNVMIADDKILRSISHLTVESYIHKTMEFWVQTDEDYKHIIYANILANKDRTIRIPKDSRYHDYVDDMNEAIIAITYYKGRKYNTMYVVNWLIEANAEIKRLNPEM